MKKYIVVVVLGLFYGCSYETNRSEFNTNKVQVAGRVFFNNKIDSLLRTFINKYPNDNCLYELYIDKKDPFEYKLTIRSILPTEEYLQKNSPVNYVTLDENIIFIYSGLEDFINKDEYSASVKTPKTEKFERIASWSYVILKDTGYLIENINPEIPFINMRQMPNVNFKSPE
jgi:hypothetical protein